ncbi:MAG: hypothetical protein IPN49_10215 [Saprospiraceae bacterium]|nr:hypothetical protein [Saprospiraceae bacterium]MBK7525637.1 hypothetical protein [Saprospiraceae bacterium]MBK8373177.1 hypothetical protein [Saprospiraceae bacterium]MBK8819434.1 hypothetical protein [Saprospiraceae bacterium]MBK9044950.1 hypothetical protein [Saprospiraceae bacterium]
MKNCFLLLITFIANKQIRLKYALIVFGILFSSITHGQSKTDAELYTIWCDVTKPETERLDAIYKRLDIDSLSNQEPEWWKKWDGEVKEAIELAIKNNKKGYLALFYVMNMSACEGNTECMCINAKKAIESAKVINTSKLPIIFWAYYTLKFDCKEDVKDELIINEFNKIKKALSNKPSDLKILRDANFSLGEWFSLNEKYPQALVYLLESLRLSEELKTLDFHYSRNYQTLANIHTQIGNYKEAEKYIDKSLQICHSIKDTLQMGSSYLGKSNLMLKFKDEANAQLYVDSAMYVMKNVKHCEPCYNIAKTLNAGIKNLSKNYSEALTELKEVEAFYNKEGGGQKPDSRFYIEKARTYLGLKKYNNAIQTINALKVSEQTYNKDVSDKYDILSNAYEGVGDNKNALKNYRLHVQTEDTLAKWRNSSEVTRLELENQFKQKQLQSDLHFQNQLNKQKSTRNWLMFLGLSTLLFALGLYSRLRYTRKTQKLLQLKNEIIEAEKEKANTALNELQSTQAQLIQSEKMASLGELTAGIAHEIQNPLNFVNNFSELSVDLTKELKEEVEKLEIPEKDKAYVTEIIGDLSQNQDKINLHGKRASSIVKGMLEHSRISNGQKETTDINALCDEYLRLAFHGLRAKDKSFNASIETHFDANLPKIKVITQDIGRVLLNIINNAFYAVSEKSKVESSKSDVHYEPKVTIGTTSMGNMVEIKITDNGGGIPDHIKDKIFQPFFTTKPTGQGTGLGLSLAFDIIKAHGGELRVESLPAEGNADHFGKGGGSEFLILLPL